MNFALEATFEGTRLADEYHCTIVRNVTWVMATMAFHPSPPDSRARRWFFHLS
jgi:hypothetical protein